MATKAEDGEEIVSEIITHEDSDKRDDSRDHMIKNYTVIPVLIYQNGYTSPTIVHSLAEIYQKQDRDNKKILGAIGNREYKNDVVWITLQSLRVKWNKVNISKMKGDRTDLMSIFYSNPNHREKNR